jgi:predicted nucleotidyltransferase
VKSAKNPGVMTVPLAVCYSCPKRDAVRHLIARNMIKISGLTCSRLEYTIVITLKKDSIMRPSQILHQNRSKVLETMISYPMLANLRVFGSVARGEDTEDSDIDFMVDALPGTTLFDLGSMQVALERLLDWPVHLLTPNELPKKFRDKSLREAKPL